MRNFKLHSVGSPLVMGLIALASGCAGGGANSAGGFSPVPIALPLALCELGGDDECGIPPVFTDADRLVLSPTNPTNPVAASYDGNGFETESVLQSNNQLRIPLDFSDDNSFSLAGERYRWQIRISSNPAEYASRPVFYCVGDPGETCIDIITRDVSNTPVAYDTATRFPVQLTVGPVIRDVDVVLSRFSLLKTFLAGSQYLFFGTAVSLTLAQTVTMTDPRGTDITFARYSRDELVAFVDGPRFDTANQLPQSGYAAYRGFANAYAESTNRNFLPFSPEAEQGAYFGFGHAAMVFSFANGVANFEHGYIDLFGKVYQDRSDGGGAIQFAPDYTNTNPLAPALSGRFADPEYLDEEAFGAVPGYVDASRFVNRVSDYADNPERQVEIGLYRRWCGPDVAVNTRADCSSGRGSGLAFRLTGNSETDDTMDFSMDLISISHGLDSSETSCYVPDSNVVCYSSRSAPNGAGQTELYGAPLTGLGSTANPEVDGSPLFAGGVWQYNQIVYVDTKGTNTESDDELLGIVDLTGTLGGHFYLAPPGPTPSP